jgi:hypothetical protein
MFFKTDVASLATPDCVTVVKTEGSPDKAAGSPLSVGEVFVTPTASGPLD